MFELIARIGEEAAGYEAASAVVAGEAERLADQKKQQMTDGTNQIAAENKEYAHTLRELGQAIGFSSVVDRLDANMRHAPRFEGFHPRAAELSWVPSAAAMTAEDGSPKDGVRAMYGWRTHWYNLSAERPPEAAVVVYSQQHEGKVQPPQATVFGFDPAKNGGKGSWEFVELLAKDSFLFEKFSRLKQLAAKPAAELSQADRVAIVAGTKAIKTVMMDGGPKARAYADTFNLLHGEFRDVAASNTTALEYGFKCASWDLAKGRHFDDFNAQYAEGLQNPAERFPRYTSDQLVAINGLFAQPATQASFLGYSLPKGRSWKNFATRWAKTSELRPGGPANQNAWPLPDVSVLNPVIEQDRIAERLQAIILSR